MSNEKKLLLVTTRVDCYDKYKEYRDCLDRELVKMLTVLGFDLLMIPNNLNNLKDVANRVSPDGIFLSGGNDISAEIYNGDPALSANTWPDRDRTEMDTIKYAIDNDVPVFGICRGMQIINVFFGGKLIQDLSKRSGKLQNHVAKNHSIYINENFDMKKYIGTIVEVNSYHNQGITDECLAAGLVATAYSDDNVIEAIKHRRFRVAGVNWHPERGGNSSNLDRDFITQFFK